MLHKELYELLQIIKRGGGLKTMCPYNSGSKRGREAHQKMYCWFFEKSCLKQMGHFWTENDLLYSRKSGSTF